MDNPFELIFNRLGNIESMLLDIQLPKSITTKSQDYNKAIRLKVAADIIGVAPTTLYSLVHQGRIKPLKPGKHLLFTKESLDAYLNGERPEKQTEDPSTYLIRNKKAAK